MGGQESAGGIEFVSMNPMHGGRRVGGVAAMPGGDVNTILSELADLKAALDTKFTTQSDKIVDEIRSEVDKAMLAKTSEPVCCSTM